MYYSYVRVSTNKQEYLRQNKAIEDFVKETGITIDKCFEDTITGKTFNRPQFNELKALAKAGDSIIIKELDRLGRDWDGIKSEWKYFADNDINVIVIDMPLLAKSIYDGDGNVDLNMKFIKLIVLETLCYVSENERVKVSKRTSESLRAKQAEGMVLGRPVDKERHKAIIELFKQGYNKSDIAFECECTRATVYSVLRENGLIQKRS
ncbi:recombinase family protein [Amedibacillus sp. YH-ame6]